MAFQDISPADRIRELSDIGNDIATMLKHMGQAIDTLSPNAKGGADARREAFEEYSKAAYVQIQSYNARMKRQAYALEEAGIIAAEAPTLSATATQQQQAQGGAPGRAGIGGGPTTDGGRITNGGLGNLDVGWLNSRGNKVGVEKEAELLQEAKVLLEKELEQKRNFEAVG